jgi:hypothetical protein
MLCDAIILSCQKFLNVVSVICILLTANPDA